MRPILLTLLACAPALAAPPKPLAELKVEGDFIDDAFALRADGQAIAYLVTDGATRCKLYLQPLPAGTPAVVEGCPTHATQVHWLGEGRVLVVAQDGERKRAQVFTAKGPGKERFGPIDDVALTEVDGKPAVVTYTRNEKKGVEHVIAAYHRDTLKPIGRRALRETAEEQVVHKQGPFKILWWRDGFLGAATLKAGEYDKAKDIRRPDRFGRFDVWKGKMLEEKEIEDVLAFARISLAHRSRPSEPAFVHLSEDHKKLLFTDGTDQHALELARPLPMYAPEAFAYQILDGARLAISATVDPMNPPALARKKADPDDLDVYVVDRATRAAERKLILEGRGRPSAWRIAGGRLALLRKNKGFDRGGVALEVYDLP